MTPIVDPEDGAGPRDVLQAAGLGAKKALGQHFLLDLGITRRIARFLGDIKGKPVLEIGPGPGGLTRALLEAGADPLIVIEKDARFVQALAVMAQWSQGRLVIIEADAMAVDEPALLATHAPAFAATGESVQIASNLPYNIGTPLTIRWLAAGPWRGAMTLMFQKEVAQRICARPGSDAYGRLAIIAQARMRPHMAMTLGRGAFSPPPKVESAVVRFEPHPSPFDDVAALEQVTLAAFSQRRKMIRSGLSSLTGGDKDAAAALARSAGIDPSERAETVPLEPFLQLARAWRAMKGTKGA